jgi:DNA-binding MarR family transcriptional regulator
MAMNQDPGTGDATARERVAAAAVARLLRAADRVARKLEVFFAPYGITGQQYNVLRILRGAREPLPTMAVAERMMQKAPGLTGILDRLEGKGLLRRDRSADDRRVWLCSITAAGEALLRRIERPLRAANVAAVRGATTAELRSLAALLDCLHDEARGVS